MQGINITKGLSIEVQILAGDGKKYTQRVCTEKYKGEPKLNAKGFAVQTEKAVLVVFKGIDNGKEYHFEAWLQKSKGTIDTEYGFGGLWKFTDRKIFFNEYTKQL